MWKRERELSRIWYSGIASNSLSSGKDTKVGGTRKA